MVSYTVWIILKRQYLNIDVILCSTKARLEPEVKYLFSTKLANLSIRLKPPVKFKTDYFYIVCILSFYHRNLFLKFGILILIKVVMCVYPL